MGWQPATLYGCLPAWSLWDREDSLWLKHPPQQQERLPRAQAALFCGFPGTGWDDGVLNGPDSLLAWDQKSVLIPNVREALKG